MFKFVLIFFISLLFVISNSSAIAAPITQSVASQTQTKIKKLNFSWQPIPSAVQYELTITNTATKEKVLDLKQIYATGYELDTAKLNKPISTLSYQVRGLDYYGKPINDYSIPQNLSSLPANVHQPMTTGHYKGMKYAPVYPVYSWIPYLGADKYIIRVFKKSNDPSMVDELLHEYENDDKDGFDFYDSASYTEDGDYYWQIQALHADNTAISDWSAPVKFYVTTENVSVAALGDSITHGGGAISTPPSYRLYDWQTYCDIPILNIGYSGDTTRNMLDRFTKDVLPFHPQVLIIMGGVNDLRKGVPAQEVIENLNTIRNLCLENNINPILLTTTPINPSLMKERVDSIAADGWSDQLLAVNKWILSYPNSIDVYSLLVDKEGWLRDDLTTDGLHPDAEGKKLIGGAVFAKLLKILPSSVPIKNN